MFPQDPAQTSRHTRQSDTTKTPLFMLKVFEEDPDSNTPGSLQGETEAQTSSRLLVSKSTGRRGGLEYRPDEQKWHREQGGMCRKYRRQIEEAPVRMVRSHPFENLGGGGGGGGRVWSSVCVTTRTFKGQFHSGAQNSEIGLSCWVVGFRCFSDVIYK